MSCGIGDIYDLIIDQGATFERSITLLNTAKKPVSLAGYTARMYVRDGYSNPVVYLTLTTENGRISIKPTLGRVDLYISAGDTANMISDKYVYDLELVDSSDEPSRVLQGSFTVRAEVTR
jgi:hypothetical protein